MLKDAIQLLSEYGWAVLFLFVSGGLLARYVVKKWPVWVERDKERLEKKEGNLQEELANHQFFSNIHYKINSEIHTLEFNDNQHPVRQKLFRKLLEIRLQCMHDLAETVTSADMNIHSAQWANRVIAAMGEADDEFEEQALRAGIPSMVVKKFLVWQHKTAEILTNYVNDLAISIVYTTNMARTNTLLYLMNLNVITTVGDAERTLIDLNGEISGMDFNGEQIEEMV